MRRDVSVVAAIPNYNMSETLESLLAQVLEQNYQAIYVLDDASTDGGASRETVASFGGEVMWVSGKQNIGSGGNRNRILDVLKHPATIHFLDADVELETPNAPDRIRAIMRDENKLAVGGLVKNAEGRQNEYNFGPRMSLHTDVSRFIQTLTHASPMQRGRLSNYLRDWPNPNARPEARPVYWMHEANMAIRSGILKVAGGFESTLRDHDIQALAIKIEKLGLQGRYFDPSVAVMQHVVQVRSGNRNLQMLRAEIAITRKFGVMDHLLPNGRFRPTI